VTLKFNFGFVHLFGILWVMAMVPETPNVSVENGNREASSP
jgi:hypothetical protein